MKEQRFEKVVEWEEVSPRAFLIFGIIYMIPILGQLFWLMTLKFCLDDRKVYWRKIK